MSLCAWTEQPEGWWATACGKAHEFTTDGPTANGYQYCPFCGGLIVATGEREDDEA